MPNRPVSANTGTRHGAISQPVSSFTVPPRAHPSAGSLRPAPPLPVEHKYPEYSLPGATQLSQVRSVSPRVQGDPCRFFVFALHCLGAGGILNVECIRPCDAKISRTTGGRNSLPIRYSRVER